MRNLSCYRVYCKLHNTKALDEIDKILPEQQIIEKFFRNALEYVKGSLSEAFRRFCNLLFNL